MYIQFTIDKDALVSLLVMKTATLLDIDSYQASQSHHYHRHEPGQFSHDDGEYDESHEENPMAMAAKVRNLPRIPINSRGL